MRDDKPADAVNEEPVVDVENGETVETQSGSTRAQPGRHGNVTLAGQNISNADCVIDNVTGQAKRLTTPAKSSKLRFHISSKTRQKPPTHAAPYLPSACIS
jgi:hypothetical protein